MSDAHFAMNNEVCLVNVDDLIDKMVRIPGGNGKVVRSWDVFSAKKIRAIPVSKCKKCSEYKPREQLRERIGDPTLTCSRRKSIIKAKWEHYDYDVGCYRNTGYRCSNCLTEWGESPAYGKHRYCPTCGAEMRLEDEEC